ncbi:ABC transporter substrate-binding protein [Enterobacter hormaechei]|nr:ABC transporter substrate-binding protein [Enterobacter hormaechei]
MKHQGVAMVISAIFAFLTAFPAIASAGKILRYTDHEPYGNMRTQFIKNVFFSEIEKESQGRLKIEAHWKGDISSSYNALSTLGQGTRADIGIVVPEYTAEQLPLHQIFKSFPLGPANGEAQVRFFHRVFQQYPQFARELGQNNLVNLQFFLGYPVGFFTRQPDVKLKQLEGTKWRTASFWHQSFLRNAGGATLVMPWNDKITDALRTGQLNGLMVNLDSGDDIHAQRAAPYIHYSPALWLGHIYLLVINKDTLNALDERDRLAIRRAAETTEKQLGAALDSGLASLTTRLENEGAKLHLLSRDEQLEWQKATRYQEVQEEWVRQQESKGNTDAGKLMHELRLLLEANARQKR